MKIEQKIKDLEGRIYLNRSRTEFPDGGTYEEMYDAYSYAYDVVEGVAESALKLLKSEVEEVERLKEIIKLHHDFSIVRQKELEMRRNYMHNLPFCSDHRDKIKGKFCRECEIERLKSVIRQVINGRWSITTLQEAIGDLTE